MSELYEHMGMKKTAMEWLNYWIEEREKVRIAKEGTDGSGDEKPKPWTQDPIFQTTYFCNVRREDDKVTRWIRQNWRPEVISWEEYDYSIVLARMLNNIPCLSDILANWPETITDFRSLQKILEARAETGGQVWGGAYLVSTHGLPMGKAAYLCQRVLPAAYAALRTDQGGWRSKLGLGVSSGLTLAPSHAKLMQLEGLGSFMAAQVIADLKNTKGHPLSKAEDWCSWSAPGPGSLRGIKWIFGKSTPATYQTNIRTITEWLSEENWLSLVAPNRTEPNMQDLQNCLCEFDKFMRVMTKTGKSKRKYNGA